MAIPPSPGKYDKESFMIHVNQIKADIQWIESQFAAMKDHEAVTAKKLEEANKAQPKDDKADKASYGMKK